MSESEDQNMAQVGRILHYVVGGPKIRLAHGSCLAAMVVKESKNGRVNLKAFPDHDATFNYYLKNIAPDHKIKTPHTWHWPRECENLQENRSFL